MRGSGGSWKALQRYSRSRTILWCMWSGRVMSMSEGSRLCCKDWKAVAMGKGPEIEVQRELMNYRNAPHPSTVKSPSELLMDRRLKTKIHDRLATSNTQAYQESRRGTRPWRWRGRGFTTKSTGLKTSVKPPFDPQPYQVEGDGDSWEIRRGCTARRKSLC